MLEIFLNPMMLAGAATGTIPVIIHLLFKQRYKRIAWAAMHWLWASQKKSTRRLRIEQFILLLIRILVLVLLAMALARPFLSTGLAVFGRANVYRILLIDNSYSMSRLSGGKSMFDRARARARQLVENLSAGDEVSILLFNTAVEPVIEEKSTNLKAAREAIEGAAISDGGTNSPAALAYACGLLLRAESKSPRKEIILITDRTRSAWMEPEGGPKRLTHAQEKDAREAIEKLAPTIHFLMIEEERDAAGNLAVSDLAPEEKLIAARAPARLVASILNLSGVEARNVSVTLHVDGERQATEILQSLLPGKAETLSFPFLFDGPGMHSVSVSVPEDVLPADNRRFLALDVRERVKVLCVEGEQGAEPLDGSLGFLCFALAPPAAEQYGDKNSIEPVRVGEAGLPEMGFEGFEIVVLGNVGVVPEDKVRALGRFVRNGGGLIVFCGDRVEPRLYNDRLLDGPERLLPARMKEIVGEPGPENKGIGFSERDLDHPAVLPLRGQKGLGLAKVNVRRRVRAEVDPKENDVRTVLNYEDGTPAAIERIVGDGRVILVTTSADRSWTDLPSRTPHLVLATLLFNHCLRDRALQMNRMVGEKISMGIPAENLGAVLREGLTLNGPGDVRLGMGIVAEQSRATSLNPMPRAGLYECHLGSGATGKRILAAANVDLAESNLDPITNPQEIVNAFEKLGLQPLSEDPAQMEMMLRENRTGQEYWRYFVGAVIALMLLETLLAWRFGNYQ